MQDREIIRQALESLRAELERLRVRVASLEAKQPTQTKTEASVELPAL